jgi:hypothetical protein
LNRWYVDGVVRTLCNTRVGPCATVLLLALWATCAPCTRPGVATTAHATAAAAAAAACRHYMAQLDDRDQLARRVTELKKQEEKLVIR